MRVLFMGTPSYATSVLKALHDSPAHEVVGLFAQPDRPVGRKQVLTPPDTKQYVLDQAWELPVYQPENIKESQWIETICALNPDVIVVAAYGQIVSKALLDICPCINLHASLLPHFRGASPIQEMILEGAPLVGVTAMYMEPSLDSGDVLGWRYLTYEDQTFEGLWELLSDAAASLILKILERLECLKPLPQVHCQASFCKKIIKQDGEASLDNALAVYRKYLAYHVWPGVHLDGGLKLKAIALAEEEAIYQRPGEILEISDSAARIACGVGSLWIMTLQPPSKKAMNSVSYLRGQRLEAGDILV